MRQLEAKRLGELRASLYRIVDCLEVMFPGRRFTPDGHLVGSIGEVLAARTFGVELLPGCAPDHDARTDDGPRVQIKFTQGTRGVSIDVEADGPVPQARERASSPAAASALGAAAAERAPRVLRELHAAAEAVDAVRAGRTGVVRVSATPPWAETVLAPAAARFHHAFPHIELRLDTATRAEGLRRLADGATDLHCGGIDSHEPLPDFLRYQV